MTIGEWFGQGGWWLVALFVGGGALFFFSTQSKLHIAVRVAGTTLGATSLSTGIGLVGVFVLGPQWLILLYPIVLMLSVVVWRTSVRFRFLPLVLVATVNWWLLLWVGFLIVTGGGGGRAIG